MESLMPFGAWTWIFLAGALLALELLAPGSFFLWFGLAAFGTGIITLLIPLPWQAQAVLFAALAVASLLGWRRYRRRRAPEGEPTLNARAQRHIGAVFTLNEPIVNGSGFVKVGDSLWRVKGPDCAAGTRVRVQGIDENTLIVTAE